VKKKSPAIIKIARPSSHAERAYWKGRPLHPSPTCHVPSGKSGTQKIKTSKEKSSKNVRHGIQKVDAKSERHIEYVSFALSLSIRPATTKIMSQRDITSKRVMSRNDIKHYV